MRLSQLALEDVEALYLGWCCDDKCSQSTIINITDNKANPWMLTQQIEKENEHILVSQNTSVYFDSSPVRCSFIV